MTRALGTDGPAEYAPDANVVKPYPFISKPPRALSPELSPSDLVHSLRQALQGGNAAGPCAQVLGVNDDKFRESATIFNGAIRTHAIILVRPLNAQDVSAVVKFCRKHDLELSVKAGGTGVHGWSVAGHVILDMSSLSEISIALPDEATGLQESFENLELSRTRSPDSYFPGMGQTSDSKRPSLASTHRASSDSTAASIKRSLDDAFLDGDSEQPDRKRGGMGDIAEESIRSDSPAGSNKSRDPDGDQNMSRSSSSGNGSGSGSASASASGSRSGGPSGSESRDGRDDSTPLTSNGSEESHKPHLQTHFSGSSADPSPPASTSGSSSAPMPQPRMTYVNPSPTTATTFPFAPATFGGGSNSSISYSSMNAMNMAPVNPMVMAMGGQNDAFAPRLVLNTNPDPPSHTIVTFGAGVQSKQLDAATAASPYGAYHVPTSAFPVGSGQFLLGGFGFIGRKHGLAMDNLVEAEMVLADGRIVWVGEGGRYGGEWKEGENPDEVWWGIRGAGPSLGVVTRFRAKAYYLPSVYAGNLIYLFDKATTPSLLRHVRDCIKGSPRTLYTNIIMTAGPPGSPAIVVFQLCFSGPRSEGDAYIQTISSWEGGRCLFQDFSERTFERQQVAVEEVLKGGKGRKWYIKSDMLTSLSDEVIDQTCARFHVVPDGCTWLFEYTGGGKCGEVADSAFPVSHREGTFTVAALHQWGFTEPPPQDTRCVTTAEDWINEVIHPNSPGGPLPCFLQSAAQEEVAAVYGENWPRLQALKRKIDPTNFFCNSGYPKAGAANGDDARTAFLSSGQAVPSVMPDGDHPVEGVSRPDLDNAAPTQPTLDKGKGRVIHPLPGTQGVDEGPNVFERLVGLDEGPQAYVHGRYVDDQVKDRYLGGNVDAGSAPSVTPSTGSLPGSDTGSGATATPVPLTATTTPTQTQRQPADTSAKATAAPMISAPEAADNVPGAQGSGAAVVATVPGE